VTKNVVGVRNAAFNVLHGRRGDHVYFWPNSGSPPPKNKRMNTRSGTSDEKGTKIRCHFVGCLVFKRGMFPCLRAL